MVASVFRRIETGPFIDDAAAQPDEATDFAFAFRAPLQRFFRHSLNDFEPVIAFKTLIFVGRHAFVSS